MTNTHGRWINFDVFPMRELCISFLGCFGAVIEVFVGVFSPGFISSIQWPHKNKKNQYTPHCHEYSSYMVHIYHICNNYTILRHFPVISPPLLYIFELTWSSKSLQIRSKLAGGEPSKPTKHIFNPQQLLTQWPVPSILIVMGPAVFFFLFGGLREAFGSKMCLLAIYVAKCQLWNAWHWPRPLRPSNKWPSSFIMIIMEPGMVYLEIMACRLGFWWQNVAGIYFSPLLSSWNQMS